MKLTKVLTQVIWRLTFTLAVLLCLAAGSANAAPLYFPHIATSIPWQTEIAIINTSDQTSHRHPEGLER